MAGVAFAVEGDGVGFATESYAASALYTTLASLSGALWRIRRVRRSCASARSFRSSTRKSRLIVNSGLRNAGLVRCSHSKSAGLVPTRVRDRFLIGHYQA